MISLNAFTTEAEVVQCKTANLFTNLRHVQEGFKNSSEVRKYCGVQSGKEVFLFEKCAVLTFHTNELASSNGFTIVFTFIKLGKCNETD